MSYIRAERRLMRSRKLLSSDCQMFYMKVEEAKIIMTAGFDALA